MSRKWALKARTLTIVAVSGAFVLVCGGDEVEGHGRAWPSQTLGLMNKWLSKDNFGDNLQRVEQISTLRGDELFNTFSSQCRDCRRRLFHYLSLALALRGCSALARRNPCNRLAPLYRTQDARAARAHDGGLVGGIGCSVLIRGCDANAERRNTSKATTGGDCEGPATRERHTRANRNATMSTPTCLQVSIASAMPSTWPEYGAYNGDRRNKSGDGHIKWSCCGLQRHGLQRH